MITIKNAQKFTTIALLSLSLSACSLFTKEVVVNSETINKPALNLEPPKELDLKDYEVEIVTPDYNKDLLNKNDILFVFTKDNFENLISNMLEMRQYIEFQDFIIDKYKEYYEEQK